MSTLDRRVARLENERPPDRRSYWHLPVPCKTTEEWLTRIKQQRDGKGRYELEALPVKGYIRRMFWVADQ